MIDQRTIKNTPMATNDDRPKNYKKESEYKLLMRYLYGFLIIVALYLVSWNQIMINVFQIYIFFIGWIVLMIIIISKFRHTASTSERKSNYISALFIGLFCIILGNVLLIEKWYDLMNMIIWPNIDMTYILSATYPIPMLSFGITMILILIKEYMNDLNIG